MTAETDELCFISLNTFNRDQTVSITPRLLQPVLLRHDAQTHYQLNYKSLSVNSLFSSSLVF